MQFGVLSREQLHRHLRFLATQQHETEGTMASETLIADSDQALREQLEQGAIALAVYKTGLASWSYERGALMDELEASQAQVALLAQHGRAATEREQVLREAIDSIAIVFHRWREGEDDTDTVAAYIEEAQALALKEHDA